MADDLNQLVNQAEEFMAKAPYLPYDLANKLLKRLHPVHPVLDVAGDTVCPSCGSVLYVDQKYCDECGSRIKWSVVNL